MPAEKISLDQAKQDKLFYFVANVVIYREDGRCLILKRDAREKVHPNKFAVPGGKLEWKDLDITKPTRMNGEVIDFEHAVEDLLKRESKEESGIDITGPFHYINSVAFVRPDGIPVLLVKLAARYESGSVVLEKGSFTDHAWVNETEVERYECIQGIQEEVKQTIELFKKPHSLNAIQHALKSFNDARDWSTPHSIKDLLLNMNEEIGEFWNLIKWVDVPTQQRMIKENKAEVENFIGDMLYLILKIAYLSEVSSEKGITDVLAEYEKRFPIDKTKGNHGNTRAGGIDLKKELESHD